MQAYWWQSLGKVRAADVGTGDLRKSAGVRTPFEIVRKTDEIDASVKTLDSNRKEVDTYILISLRLDHAVIVFFPPLNDTYHLGSVGQALVRGNPEQIFSARHALPVSKNQSLAQSDKFDQGAQKNPRHTDEA